MYIYRNALAPYGPYLISPKMIPVNFVCLFPESIHLLYFVDNPMQQQSVISVNSVSFSLERRHL
ncbi:hypothetical protein Hanom_Chr04g00316611 [Helianthus anomalus]